MKTTQKKINYKTITNPKTNEILIVGYHVLERLKEKNNITYEILIDIIKGFKHQYGYSMCNNSSVINKKRLHNPPSYNYLYSLGHNLCLMYDSKTKYVITMFHLDTHYYNDSNSGKWYQPIKKKW
jgi:hypothetical protein